MLKSILLFIKAHVVATAITTTVVVGTIVVTPIVIEQIQKNDMSVIKENSTEQPQTSKNMQEEVEVPKFNPETDTYDRSKYHTSEEYMTVFFAFSGAKTDFSGSAISSELIRKKNINETGCYYPYIFYDYTNEFYVVYYHEIPQDEFESLTQVLKDSYVSIEIYTKEEIYNLLDINEEYILENIQAREEDTTTLEEIISTAKNVAAEMGYTPDIERYN